MGFGVAVARLRIAPTTSATRNAGTPVRMGHSGSESTETRQKSGAPQWLRTGPAAACAYASMATGAAACAAVDLSALRSRTC